MSAWNEILWLPMTTFVFGIEFMVQTLRAVQQAAQRIAPPTTLKETGEMSHNCGCDDQCGKPFCEVKVYEYYIVSVKPCKEKILQELKPIVVTSDMSGEAFTSYAIARFCLQNPNFPEEDARYLRVCYRLNCTFPKERKDCCADDQVEILRQIRDAIGGQQAA